MRLTTTVASWAASDTASTTCSRDAPVSSTTDCRSKGLEVPVANSGTAYRSEGRGQSGENGEGTSEAASGQQRLEESVTMVSNGRAGVKGRQSNKIHVLPRIGELQSG